VFFLVFLFVFLRYCYLFFVFFFFFSSVSFFFLFCFFLFFFFFFLFVFFPFSCAYYVFGVLYFGSSFGSFLFYAGLALLLGFLIVVVALLFLARGSPDMLLAISLHAGTLLPEFIFVDID